MFNERAVCQAIIDCCAELEWPAQRLKIQVGRRAGRRRGGEGAWGRPVQVSTEAAKGRGLACGCWGLRRWLRGEGSQGAVASCPLRNPPARSPGFPAAPSCPLTSPLGGPPSQVLDDSTDAVTRELVDEKVGRGAVTECAAGGL